MYVTFKVECFVYYSFTIIWGLNLFILVYTISIKLTFTKMTECSWFLNKNKITIVSYVCQSLITTINMV